MMVLIIAFQHGDVEPGLKARLLGGIGATASADVVHHDQFWRPRLGGVLDEGRGDRMVIVGLAPITHMTSAIRSAANVRDTAPELRPSNSAATDDAWQSRVTMVRHYWSRNPSGRASGTDKLSSFDPLAEPKPASAFAPFFVSNFGRGPLPRWSSASSQEASRKCVNGLAGSTWSLESFFAFGSRTNGLVRRWGWWM